MRTTAKRCASAAIAILLTLPLVSATTATAAPTRQETARVTPGPSDWPTDRYNNERVNANLAETSLSPSNVGRLHLAWSTSSSLIEHNPIVIGDSVYAICAPALCSYDRVSGSINWSTPLWNGPGAAVTSDPTYGNGLLYVGFGESLIAFDASTGTRVWTDSFLNDPYQPNSTVQFSPIYDNGMVFVSTNSFTVHAVRAATGAQVWSAADGGISELSADHGYLYAGNIYEEQTGTALVASSHNGWPGPVVITDDGRLINGFSQWAAQGNTDPYLQPAKTPQFQAFPEPSWQSDRQPAVADNTLYYSVGGLGGPHSTDDPLGSPHLDALKLIDPFYGGYTHDWQTLLPADGDLGAPTVADGVVYALSSTGVVYAANATSGGLVWDYATNSTYPADPYFTSPVVADGMLFVVSGQQLFAFTTDPGDSAGVPAQPTQLVTTDGDGQVSLAWTEPSTAGAATSYQVAISPSGRTVTTGGTAVTITGLNDWTPYTFTITARNAAGPSAPLTTAPIQPRPQFTIAIVRRNGHVALRGAGRWVSLGGQARSAPAVVSVAGEPYVFVRGPDQRIWVGGPHTPWQRFGPAGTCASAPAASMSITGNLVEVACRASDNHLLTATSAEPNPSVVPHASAWTYSPITLRGRPAVGPTPSSGQSTDGLIAVVCPVKPGSAVTVYGDDSLGTNTLPTSCGGSLTLADRPAAGAGPMFAMKYTDPNGPSYLDVGQGNTGAGLIAYPFIGGIGIAATGAGPIVVGINKAGNVLAQIPAPNGGWGVERWRGWGGPDPVFLTFGSHAKYGAAVTTTYAAG